MATLVLTTAASALTAGGPQWLVAAAAVAASVAGSYVDSQLFGTTVSREGPRLSETTIQTSTEGAPLPEMAGRLRLSGQVIWASRFREEASTESSGGGKGGGGTRSEVTTYSYYGNFAVGLCEGPVDRVWRIWADGKPMDLTNVTWRVYPGDDTQDPDPLIEGIEGTGRVPAYRGTAYVVFEDLPLAAYGNRLPQLVFEVCRRVPPVTGTPLESLIEAVTLIPGSGEFAYDTRVITTGSADSAAGAQGPQNRSGGDARADILPALDDLAASLPEVRKVFLVVGWYGDDLRAGHCQIRPKVDKTVKATFAGRTAVAWRVHTLGRAAAAVVSTSAYDGRLAYGGTPSDESVVRAIRELKARGYTVVLYPFVFMDVPADNELPDPWSDHGAGVGQPAYPWRGRITASIAPGHAGTPDGTAAVLAEIASFAGSATREQVSVSVSTANIVVCGYSGPDEWSFRRLVLHYARLAAAVNAIAPGAVTGFVIGSELRGLTTLRDDGGNYPFVNVLRALASDCRAILGGAVALTYAADWTEYFGHQPAGGDVRFHLDPLWADAAIDAIGIDNYLPLSDWRDGEDHLDRQAGWSGPYDPDYLDANIEGGERFDWYYASEADRVAQLRSPIADGAYGKPWVFRPKDIRAWWSNFHHERTGGIEAASPTAYVPMAKPIWFTELGIPSIDRGTNQPNVFYDPKSSESALPHFSAGTRDDLVQRAGLEAWLRHFGPDVPTNPLSPVYGGRMVQAIAVWTWDARPFPAWPARGDFWGDGDLWPLGHWLNGKVGLADLGGLVLSICARVGLAAADVDVSTLRGVVPGYLRDRPLSPRAELEALMNAYGLDVAETGGRLRFRHRGDDAVLTLQAGDLVAEDAGDFTVTRAQETDLPSEVVVGFVDVARDYRQTTVTSRRLGGVARGRREIALPFVMDDAQARDCADRLLSEAWIGRDSARFTLPPSALALDPGDTVVLALPRSSHTVALGRIADDGARRLEATAVEPAAHRLALAGGRPERIDRLPDPVGLALSFLDLPVIDETVAEHLPYVAASSTPAVTISVMASATGESFAPNTQLAASATIGLTTYDLYDGPTDYWDEGNVLGVNLFSGALSSQPRESLLAGRANAIAVQNGDGEWEILQFAVAMPRGSRLYDLTGLLRGRLGTEQAMRAPLPAGAPVVLLDRALRPLDLPASARNVAWHYRFGPAGLPYTDPAWDAADFIARAIGLRPLAPCHVTGRRDAVGNLSLTWIRRTRRGGHWADGTDTPLSEEREAYEVDILDGAGPGVVRTIAASAAQAVYTAAQATDDFGWVPAAVVLRVFQVSASYGRGLAATVTV
ncbi:baseplate multidomain protein megatron [Zavarzinia aquatilis]|uniref:Host specificity protein n=1 Tax=Zavarzinia aquatilis TaxID=2211142 RepID=A0A317E6M1_9PROT|nr:glycoside hydrolase/phage tail family protein [Zavarzinia aquatilis]PWR22758.1 hypothetical protein DKG74_09995 [Zavarzinia aquatilis]